jgi:hypothetical protein
VILRAWETLRDWMAKIGQNEEFIAFQAHCWFAYAVTLTVWLLGYRFFFVSVVVVLAAAVKEFWFDARYEKLPPQTAEDNLVDFVGYLSGVALATLFAHFL